MTSFGVVYDAFLSKILDDEWTGWTQQEVEADLFEILKMAIFRFRFPRVSLEYNSQGFTDTLSNDEIQILASFMRCEWLGRSVLRWDNIKPLYIERDFSQANFLDKLNAALAAEEKKVARLEDSYYRSVNKKPFNYGQMASPVLGRKAEPKTPESPGDANIYLTAKE